VADRSQFWQNVDATKPNKLSRLSVRQLRDYQTYFLEVQGDYNPALPPHENTVASERLTLLQDEIGSRRGKRQPGASVAERRHKQVIVWMIISAAVAVVGVLVTILTLYRPSSPPSPSPPSTLNTLAAQRLSSPATPFVFPSASPRPAETKNPSPIASATPAESGLMEMTIQQFTRRYLELDGRYAEQEAFLKRADRKRVRWKVSFLFPTSHNHEVVLQFDVPAESHHEKPLIGSPVHWANFPLSFRDRLYSLRRGDLVEISGVLRFVENTLVIAGDDFDVVTAPTLTPTPRTKKSR